MINPKQARTLNDERTFREFEQLMESVEEFCEYAGEFIENSAKSGFHTLVIPIPDNLCSMVGENMLSSVLISNGWEGNYEFDNDRNRIMFKW